ncbi:MAG: pyridine nucleotide-disulfide oxidoreductase [Rhodanobacteraceae bacterium]|nr:MAG: pyridine nucleotide-disulfide oxidoreductase [Rhodanobacteraceae bacterium]
MPRLGSLSARHLIGVLLAALIVAAVVIGLHHGLSLTALQRSRQALASHAVAHPFLFAGGFFAVYVAYAAAALPGIEVLSLAAGALFSLIEGTVLVSFASTLGATLAMLASRFLFRDAVVRHFGARLQGIDRGLARDGAFYLFSLRLIPAVPFFLINLLAGLAPIRARTYWWVSQLGMLPATLVYVNAGTGLGKVTSLSGLLSPPLIGSLLLLAALPWLARALMAILRRRRLYRRWPKPRHFDRNLVVIGAGAAGLVSAYIAATLRAKVTLVEAERMGGECLNTGCVPSKALIRIARTVHEVRQAARFGVDAPEPHIDFAATMQRVREAIAAIAPHDSEARYRKLGVDVRHGHARIASPWCVEVDGKPVTTRAIVIAAGAEPLLPDLPGLREAGYLTSETLWTLDTLPERLLILGGGPIGCELSQAFARLGSQVTVVELSERLLSREDGEVSAFVEARLREDGVEIRTGHKALHVVADSRGKALVCARGDAEVSVPFDAILVAIGRQPRVAGYGLEELGIPFASQRTVETDAYLQTLYPNIHACGDVAGPWQLTHAGAHQAWYATINALFGGIKRFRVDGRVMPAVTFTDPEVARVGLNEREARERGVDYAVTRYDLGELDRALTEQASQGFVKVLTVPGKDRVLGATCVGPHAGEWITEWALAMRHRIGMNGVLATVHAYPTFAEANRYVAGAWKRAHAPERLLKWLERWQRWRRHEGSRRTTDTHQHRKEVAQ